MSNAAQENELRPRRRVGRFELFTEIASGGMATIHLGRIIGASDFARVVAIKRLHPHFAKDPMFSRMFLDEARLVARIRHPNVLPTIDLIEGSGELFIVMEYVEGETFATLMREARKRKERVPVGVSLRIMSGALHGLHAAHEATNERGELLNLVHRDVSPENIMVGTDGFARLLDFGIARALGMYSQTREGEVKGKLAYMTPEQVLGDTITCRTDVFAASAVLWQALTGRQLFKGKHVGEYTHKILYKAVDPPSYVLPDLPKKLDSIVLRGLEREQAQRWPSAQAMAEAIEAVGDLASQREVGVWVRRLAAERLNGLSRKVAAIENSPRDVVPMSLPPPSSQGGDRPARSARPSDLEREAVPDEGPPSAPVRPAPPPEMLRKVARKGWRRAADPGGAPDDEPPSSGDPQPGASASDAPPSADESAPAAPPDPDALAPDPPAPPIELAQRGPEVAAADDHSVAQESEEGPGPAEQSAALDKLAHRGSYVRRLWAGKATFVVATAGALVLLVAAVALWRPGKAGDRALGPPPGRSAAATDGAAAQTASSAQPTAALADSGTRADSAALSATGSATGASTAAPSSAPAEPPTATRSHSVGSPTGSAGSHAPKSGTAGKPGSTNKGKKPKGSLYGRE